MFRFMYATVCLLVVMLAATPAMASVVVVTGNPNADGFASFGNSLSNGVYVRGDANYGYDTYAAGFTIQTGSNLIDSSWQVGDTVLAAGGIFAPIAATEAGWSAFTGNAVNSLLSSATSGPKLQAKFGNSDSTWTTSTIAPSGGNGVGSLSNGDGDLPTSGVAIQIRTGTYYTETGPAYVPGQEQAGILGWDTNAGVLMQLGKSSYVDLSVGGALAGMDRDVGRVIWSASTEGTDYPDSWELFLNVSLVDRLNPSFTGLLPAIGDKVLMTVQNNDSAITDALANTVPEPGTLVLLLTAGLGLLAYAWRRR